MLPQAWGWGRGGAPAVQGVGDPGPAHFAPRESADKVVLHTGKYEELIVCSHEIAASTAQLVAASKVRLPLPPWEGDRGAVAQPVGPSLSHPGAPPPPGEGRQAQPPPESPAGVLTHRQ